MKRSSFIVLLLLIAIFVSSIGLYAGHFLFEKKNGPPSSVIQKKQKQQPVLYKHLDTSINGLIQKINILEIDISSGAADILPVLSFDRVFGFEKLDAMASRKGAYAAVNAGFFYEYGRPTGLVCIDGRLITNSTGMFPVFMIKNGRAHLSQVKTELWLLSNKKKLRLDNINAPGKAGEFVLYTPEYGSENRVEGDNTTIIIKKNIITGIAVGKGSTEIPEEGMLVTAVRPESITSGEIPFSTGEKVEFLYKPDIGTQAYECGGWVVRDGKVAAGDRDAWIGLLTNRDPRTVIGIKNDGKVILITVDGRQPGYSAGMTGKELGNYLVSYGVRNAAMLDGGASTTMIVKGKLVNRPSDRGRERPLGGGIIIKLTGDN